jgi:hypothetical protein
MDGGQNKKNRFFGFQMVKKTINQWLANVALA